MEELKKEVETYREELGFMHPFVTSDKFVDNSYQKWACSEILKEIEFSKKLPFTLTPLQLLEQFAEKMKRYSCMNLKNSLIFTIAAETAEYMTEQCWISDWRKNGRGRR
jgi:hypothetical protein